MEELIQILTEIRDQKSVSGNSAYKVGDALLRIRQCLADTDAELEQFTKKIVSTDTTTSIVQDSHKLSLTNDGRVIVEASDKEEELLTRNNFMPQNITFRAADFVQESDGLWTTPPIQLLIGNAQVQITSASASTVTVYRSNSPTTAFAEIKGWSEVPAIPVDAFCISGGVAGMYIKIKFSVKPVSISVLS